MRPASTRLPSAGRQRRFRKSPSPQDQATLNRTLARPGVRDALGARCPRELPARRRDGERTHPLQQALGFSLHDISAPVHLWHGLQDPKVPVELARRVETGLPSCRSQLVEGATWSCAITSERSSPHAKPMCSSARERDQGCRGEAGGGDRVRRDACLRLSGPGA